MFCPVFVLFKSGISTHTSCSYGVSRRVSVRVASRESKNRPLAYWPTWHRRVDTTKRFDTRIARKQRLFSMNVHDGYKIEKHLKSRPKIIIELFKPVFGRLLLIVVVVDTITVVYGIYFVYLCG